MSRPCRLVLAMIAACATPVQAEQLFTGTTWSAVAADDKARTVGDTVTVKYAEGEGSILQAYSVAKAVPAA